MLETIQSAMEDIARCASVGDTADSALRWLARERKEWLLLFDNADDPNLNLRQFFPRCRHGNIIVTSRNKACRLQAPDSNYCVAAMEPNEAIELLLKTAMVEPTDENRRLCADIAHQLGYLALAISQAGAYIAQSSCLDDYLQIYHEDRAELLCRHAVQTTDDYEWTVYTTWETSLKKLEPTSAMFLRLCSFMHYDGISKQIFKEAAAAEVAGDLFQDAICFLQNFKSVNGKWSDIRFLDLINELASYSLINVGAKGNVYSIHPLVHAWAGDRTSPAEKMDARVCTMQILALSASKSDHSTEAFAFRRTLLPHIDQIRTEIVESDIAAILYKVYQEAGRWKDAVILQRLVVETLGDGHPTALRIMPDLGLAYIRLGRWKEAETLLIEVMEARKKTLGDEHPDTLTVMANLGLAYRKQGRWKNAEMLMTKVMDARKRVLGDDHPDTLTVMTHLGWTYSEQGHWEEAETLMTKIMEATRKVLGEEHPDTLTVMSHLGWTYSELGRWKEAEMLMTTVMEVRTRLLGDDHPETLQVMNNLGLVLSQQGRFEESDKQLLATLDKSKRVLGDEHPATLNVMDSLGWSYSRQRRWKEAEALQLMVMKMNKRVLGDEHPATLSVMSGLASTHARQGRWQEAETLEAMVLETRRTLLDDDHPLMLQSISALSDYRNCQLSAPTQNLT